MSTNETCAWFQAKPFKFRARQWFKDGDHDAVQLAFGEGWFFVQTRQGLARVDPGDWIITLPDGETYPCKPDVFALKYDPVAPEHAPCSTYSRSTVVPPDRATWDILCAYLAGEEHHGSDISEGRLTEILKHRIGWCRDDVRTAWYDAVERGNALIEADHERIRPIREAEAARLMAEAERRRGGSEPTGSGSSSGSN